MRRIHTLLAVLPLVVAACGDSTDTTTSEVSPFHVVSADAVGFEGTATCDFDTDPLECEFDMSDPRISGTETTDRYVDLISDDGWMWVAEGLFTNDEGTWRGTVMAVEYPPCGEAHYIGEGAYEGLEAHWYFCHVPLSEPADVRGWIQDRT